MGIRAATGLARAARPAALALAALLMPAPGPAQTCTWGGTPSLAMPALAALRSDARLLAAPARLAVDGEGRSYVTDPSGGRLLVRDAKGRLVRLLEGLGRPLGVAVDAFGVAYVGDELNGSVSLFLARHFLRVFAERQKKDIREFSTEAMRVLLNYRWPGNVRELENTIEHAVVLAKGQAVEAVDLPAGLMRPASEAAAPPSKTITDNEARLLREVLEECNWNKTEVAMRLGISRSTLYEKIRKYQLSPPTMH